MREFLIARADMDVPDALFALDEATPMELAVAALLAPLGPARVAPVAAH